MHSRKRILRPLPGLIAAILLLAPAGATAAAAHQPDDEADREQIVRVHGIRDLLHDEQDRAEATALVPAHRMRVVGGLRHVPAAVPARQDRIGEVVVMIGSVVAPADWDFNGGTNNMLVFRDQLIVRAPADVQRQVADLLEELRAGRPTLRLRATWVRLSPEQANAIRAGQEEEQGAPGLSDLDQSGIETRLEAEITCRDGQLTHVAAGPARLLVSNVSPVVAQGAVGYDPTADLIQGGVFLQARPTLVGDDRAAVDLDSLVTEFRRTQRQSQWIDDIELSTQRLTASLVVPLDRWMLAGAMSVEGAEEEGPSQPLYLLVRVGLER